MTARELVELWVQRFNDSDFKGLGQLYHENAVNHQTAIGFIRGKKDIQQRFQDEFEQFDMLCLIENIFQDDHVAILEWKDPKGLRGCIVFWIENQLITYQRGYFDQLTFLNQQAPE